MARCSSVHHEFTRGRARLRRIAPAGLAAVALLVPAAAARAQTYDLTVTIQPANPLSFDSDDPSWTHTLDWTVRVANNGPDPSPATTLTVQPPGATSGVDCGLTTLATSNPQCQVPSLDSGEAFDVLVVGRVVHADLAAGPPRATAQVPCGSPQESDCSANSSAAAAMVAYAPHIQLSTQPGARRAHRRLVLRGSASPTTSDPASAVSRVEVALVRKGATACRWLNTRGGLTPRSTAAGGCSQPIWLTAAGTSSWQHAIAAGLPAGGYTAYARATSASGATDLSFTRSRGNAITLRVR